MQGFMHFYCEKLLEARNRDRGGRNRPTGAEDVKHNRGENLAGGSTPLTSPVNLHPVLIHHLGLTFVLTHSLTATRNRLWVVAPSMLTDRRRQPMRQQQ